MKAIQHEKLFGIKGTLPQISKPGLHDCTTLKQPVGVAERECIRIKLKAESRKAEAFKIVRHSTLT
jgi:hypothetical protein